MSAARILGDFENLCDAHDELVHRGFYKFTERTYQHRFNHKTAHVTVGSDGSASVTII